MSDETRPNLEPIDESDLNLKEKFIGGAKIEKNLNELEGKAEVPHIIEAKAERKEGAMEKESAYSKILSKIGSQKQPLHPDSVVISDATIVNVSLDAESKINNLVILAETKGIPHAVKVARHMEDNYTLDEFHDRLLGEELRLALVKKGLIKEI